MTDPEVGRARLVAQGLVTRPWATPTEAVRASMAMQGQDLPGAMASAALRTTSRSVDEVIAAMDARGIVRGYPMRGTVFLMAAEDLLWTSQLCNAGALRAARKRRASLELTDAMVEKARGIALGVLPGHERGLPRAELFALWEQAGTPTGSGRGYHVLAHLVGEGDLCYGPWNGTDQNVVTTTQWLPAGTSLEERFNGERLPAVAEMLGRYLASHGPATLRDFAWWTKLPLKEIRAAWGQVGDQFETGAWGEELPDARHWRPGLTAELADCGTEVDRPLLLPGFDEFILGYVDRLFAMTPEQHALLVPGNNGVFGRAVVSGGQVVGIWKREGRAGKRSLSVKGFAELGVELSELLEADFARFPFATP